MKSRNVSAFAFGFALVLASPQIGHSSCNIVPSGDGFAPSPPSDSVKLVGFNGPDQFPFKGALGRVDRVYLLPGQTSSFAVLGDGVCVSEPERRAAVPEFASPDDVVAAILIPRGTKVLASVYASGATCHALAAALPVGPAVAGRVSIELLPGCGNAGVQVLQSPSAGSAVVLPVRPTAALPAATNISAKSDSGVRLFVASKPATSEALVSLFETAVAGTCTTQCGALARGGATACVDDFYTLAASATAGGTAAYVLDRVPCKLQMPPTMDPNDFAKQCHTALGLDPSLALPVCSGPPTQLDLWQDTCGGVHIPFDWTAIRDGGVGGKDLKRVVAGRSAVAEKIEAEGARIRVPGPEFIGSTPKDDLVGNDPKVSWRKPEIDLWKPQGVVEEFGLYGVVDQNDSVVHIYPRLAVNTLCIGNEACFGLTREVDGSVNPCACEDEYGPDCNCKPDTNPAPPAQYFVCKGGPTVGRPCTRSNHCGHGGSCTGQPRCRKKGAVWDPSVIPDIDVGTACWNDATCKDLDPDPANVQCGYALFDFSTRATGAGGAFTLDADIDTTSARNERGVCDDDGKPCSKGGGGKLAKCATGTCVGFVLEAQGVR